MAPIDKLSTVLAIILALILLGEPVSAAGAAGIVAITAGTLLMVEPSELSDLPEDRRQRGKQSGRKRERQPAPAPAQCSRKAR